MLVPIISSWISPKLLNDLRSHQDEKCSPSPSIPAEVSRIPSHDDVAGLSPSELSSPASSTSLCSVGKVKVSLGLSLTPVDGTVVMTVTVTTTGRDDRAESFERAQSITSRAFVASPAQASDRASPAMLSSAAQVMADTIRQVEMDFQVEGMAVTCSESLAVVDLHRMLGIDLFCRHSHILVERNSSCQPCNMASRPVQRPFAAASYERSRRDAVIRSNQTIYHAANPRGVLAS